MLFVKDVRKQLSQIMQKIAKGQFVYYQGVYISHALGLRPSDF